MKTIAELNPHNYPITNPNIQNNLDTLFLRILEVQGAYGKDLVVSSGLRSDAQQADLIASGKTGAVHSKHLAGAACDILDKSGAFTKWVKENLKLMEVIGLWMEDFDSIAELAKKHKTSKWVHFQILQPKSGKRVFIP
jgi:hypothetical protein